MWVKIIRFSINRLPFIYICYMSNAVPVNSAGRILLELFGADYIAKNAIHYVYPSGDDAMQKNDESRVNAEFNESQIRALKALGYIGE